MAARAVRTYYWNGARWLWKRPWRTPALKTGNAGDLLAADLIAHLYGRVPRNVSRGPRLLVVGSIAHIAQPSDVLCGIGVKHPELVGENLRGVRVWGVRGPKSLELLERAGADLSELRFVFDPGMLAGQLYPVDEQVEPRGRIFVPHYREARSYLGRPLRDLRVVSVDTRPEQLVNAIRSAEVVYTSSLHGVIFAHAVGRPVVLVSPQTEEPLFKYEDHFASVGVAWRRPYAHIEDALATPAPTSPASLHSDLTSFAAPPIDLLESLGIS